MRIGVCAASRLGVFMSCIVNLMRWRVAMQRCDALLHDAGIELKSIRAFFSDATCYVYCEPALRLIASN